mmetsp:Transcript_555/g.774  ORF Transcript_555/g.774 Transcript_555/m.774 type:complete len:231 (+) Transcript_555:72-764(+)
MATTVKFEPEETEIKPETVETEPIKIEAIECEANRPNFPPISERKKTTLKRDSRRIRCPKNRISPLRESWDKIVAPITEHMLLQIRFIKGKNVVEIRNSPATKDPSALQKAADFIQAFILGFYIQDAIALLRLEDLFVESFEIGDVKPLAGDHLSRAIGRIVGQDGKTRIAIENATKTRIVIAGHKIHLLGSFSNIKSARNSICALILGAPPGKVYNQLRNVARRMNDRF